MLPRLRRPALAAALLLMPALPAAAQTDEPLIQIVELSGPLDSRTISFAVDQIEEAGASRVEVVILQLDSPGVIAPVAELGRLVDLVSDPPVPVVAWVGPAPARAYGGVAQLVAASPLAAAAPGTEIGWWRPTIAGDAGSGPLVDPPVPAVDDATIEVAGPVPGLIDLASAETASPRQLAQALDGLTVGGVTLSTLRPFTAPDGSIGITALPTVISQPGLWTRFLRLASSPEATFFLLVAGLAVAAFEFYAIGPGIAAAVAVISLALASYGVAVLPVRWWAVGLTLAALAALTAGHQRADRRWMTAVGLAALVPAGLWFTDAAPQIRPGVAGVVSTVAAAGFFFLLAMPTVARARFSTQTIGREGLIGKTGRARGPLTPDGVVEVDGALWRATSHRAAGIADGDQVSVVGVDGWYLEVEGGGRENLA